MRYHANNIDYADLIIGTGEWGNKLSPLNLSGAEIFSDFETIKNKYNIQKEMPYFEPYFISIYANGEMVRGIGNLRIIVNNPIKKYDYQNLADFNNKFPDFLLPSDGNNLFTIIDHNKDLRKEISEIFSEYGLQFVAYKKEGKFELEKKLIDTSASTIIRVLQIHLNDYFFISQLLIPILIQF